MPQVHKDKGAPALGAGRGKNDSHVGKRAALEPGEEAEALDDHPCCEERLGQLAKGVGCGGPPARAGDAAERSHVCGFQAPEVRRRWGEPQTGAMEEARTDTRPCDHGSQGA